MSFGYLLPKNQRISGLNPIYKPSKPDLNYYSSSGKIATLLILNEKVENISFSREDKTLFERMSNMSYTDTEMKIDDMKRNSSIILREQSIIAGVSNWECYFSDICEIIFNDDKFIEKLISNDNKKDLKKILKEFKIFQDLQEEYFLNANEINGLKFGTYIIENRKINFQDSEILHNLFKKLFDLNLANIEGTNWAEIKQFIKDRHELIHNANNQRIIDGYSKEKIEQIIKDMSLLISKVDKTLFTICGSLEGYR